jgi:hypothetical protein
MSGYPSYLCGEGRNPTRDARGCALRSSGRGIWRRKEELRRFDELVNRCRCGELIVEVFEFYSTLLVTQP